MKPFIQETIRRLPWVLLATLVGGLAFTWVQATFDTWGDIGTWMGQQIVQKGGYQDQYTGPIGWTTHLAISFGYTLLIAVIVAFPFYPTKKMSRLFTHLVLALILGWGTTLITTPAIAVTVSILAGQGFPSELPGLNFKIYLALWNHILFFVLGFVLVGVIPDFLASAGNQNVNA